MGSSMNAKAKSALVSLSLSGLVGTSDAESRIAL